MPKHLVRRFATSSEFHQLAVMPILMRFSPNHSRGLGYANIKSHHGYVITRIRVYYVERALECQRYAF